MLSTEATAVTPLPSAAVEPENNPIWPSLPAAKVQGTPCYVAAVSMSKAIWVRKRMSKSSALQQRQFNYLAKRVRWKAHIDDPTNNDTPRQLAPAARPANRGCDDIAAILKGHRANHRFNKCFFNFSTRSRDDVRQAVPGVVSTMQPVKWVRAGED